MGSRLALFVAILMPAHMTTIKPPEPQHKFTAVTSFVEGTYNEDALSNQAFQERFKKHQIQ